MEINVIRPINEENWLYNESIKVIAKAVFNGRQEDWREITPEEKSRIEEEESVTVS